MTDTVSSALVHLKTMVEQCTLCELHTTRKQTVFARGDGSSGLLIVGEAPGENEDETGEPFVGSSGQVLDKLIRSVGLAPEAVYICNVIKCRPPGNRVPTKAEVSACRSYLFRQIMLVKPRVIVTLGQTAARTVITPSAWPGMIAFRGKWQQAFGADVMPTFHPSYTFRVKTARATMLEDLRAAAEKLGLAP
jgi:uracil-DNA glycosylase family 4